MAGGWSEIFATHLTPFMLIGECGAPLAKSEGKHTTVCPCCGSQMHVLTHDLVCSNDSCNERTLTGFEFLAHSSFKGSLDKAADVAMDILRSKKIPVSVPKSEILDYYTKLRSVRKLFETPDTQEKKRLYLHSLADGWLRRNKLDPGVIHRVSQVWTSRDMDYYNELVSPENPLHVHDNEFVLAVPYHSSFSEVGAVLFLRDGHSKPVLHRIESYRYMWAGLQNLRPEAGACFTTQNFAKFFQCLGGGKYQHPDYPFTCLLYDGLCSRTKYMPDHPVYLFDPQADISLTAVASLYRDKPCLEVSDCRKPLSGIKHASWKDFIIEECARRVLSGSFPIPDTILQFVDSCKLVHAQERRLCKFLRESGYREKAEGLDKHFSTRVIMDEDKVRIHAGPEGYFAVHHKTGVRTDITNFLVTPQDNVAFREARELTTRLNIEHEGSSFGVSLPMSALDAPSLFEDHVRSGWMGVTGTTTAVPILKDRALFRKYLSRYLKDCASTLPCKNGVSYLGWSFRKDEYQGPGWAVRRDGLKQEDSVLHQDKPFLESFENRDLPATTDLDTDRLLINPLLAEITCLFLGYLYRGRFERRAWSTEIESSEEDWHKLAESWASLGQRVSVRQYDPKITAYENGNHGYLFLTDNTRSKSQGGGVGRKPRPDNVLDHITTPELEAWWVWMLEKGVAACLQRDSPWLSTRPRLDDKFLLLQEGQKLLQEITGMFETEFESPYKELEELMEGISCDDIGTLIAIDLEQGKLALNKELLHTDDQLRELCILTGDVNMGEDAWRVGMTSLSGPLASFYQTERIPYGRLQDGKFVSR
jgi:hypothetical protein